MAHKLHHRFYLYIECPIIALNLEGTDTGFELRVDSPISKPPKI